MELLDKRKYVEENLKYLPEKEKNQFDFNFVCVLTKNSVGMESGITANLVDVVSIIKGTNNNCSEELKRDVLNHYDGYLKMIKYLNENPNGLISEDIIKDIHKSIVNGVIDGGNYRKVNIKVNNSNYVPCDYIKVYDRMHKYVDTVNSMENNIDKVVYAHLQLHKIHPFLDGNGRLCRLILNYVLYSMGYLPINIPAKRRDEYFDCLEEFKVNKNSEPFKLFLLDLMNKEYDRLIDLINEFKK